VNIRNRFERIERGKDVASGRVALDPTSLFCRVSPDRRHAVGRMFGVGASCVIKLVQRYRETGTVRAAKFGGYRRPILAEHEAKVRDLVAARPDMTISELASELAALGIKVGRSSVYRFLRRSGFTFKNAWSAPFARGLC
jgi:transposase